MYEGVRKPLVGAEPSAFALYTVCSTLGVSFHVKDECGQADVTHVPGAEWSLGRPEIYYIDPANIELTDTVQIPTPSAGVKGKHHHPQIYLVLYG